MADDSTEKKTQPEGLLNYYVQPLSITNASPARPVNGNSSGEKILLKKHYLMILRDKMKITMNYLKSKKRKKLNIYLIYQNHENKDLSATS